MDKRDVFVSYAAEGNEIGNIVLTVTNYDNSIQTVEKMNKYLRDKKGIKVIILYWCVLSKQGIIKRILAKIFKSPTPGSADTAAEGAQG